MNPLDTPSGLIHTALVVDDNFYNRQIFHIALESVGYTVSESEDGAKSTSILGGKTFDLLILDLQMPAMDGRSVLRIVRSNPLHKDMRIIVVTANAHMATEDIDDMADYVMHKPIDVVEFSEFVRRLKRIPLAGE